MRATKFTMDVLEDKLSPNAFDGYTDGDTWNGWSCPRFTKEQADIFLAAWNALADADEPVVYPGRYIAETDCYQFDTEGWENPACDTYPGYDFDGLHVYAIGAYGWCWTEVEANG